MRNFFDYKAKLSDFEQQFNQAVDDLLNEYPQLVSSAAFQLGSLFDRAEYPDVEDLRHKFRFRYAFMPVPASGDFRIDTEEETKRELQSQYEKFYEEKLNGALKDVWGRLHDCLSRMSEKLADAPNPRKTKDGEEVKTQIFRDTLVNNAVELCDLLSKLNVTDDPKLESARRELEKAISGVTPKELRENDHVRLDVKSRVDDILKNFDF